jgi:hypothetical protein
MIDFKGLSLADDGVGCLLPFSDRSDLSTK